MKADAAVAAARRRRRSPRRRPGGRRGDRVAGPVREDDGARLRWLRGARGRSAAIEPGPPSQPGQWATWGRASVTRPGVHPRRRRPRRPSSTPRVARAPRPTRQLLLAKGLAGWRWRSRSSSPRPAPTRRMAWARQLQRQGRGGGAAGDPRRLLVDKSPSNPIRSRTSLPGDDVAEGSRSRAAPGVRRRDDEELAARGPGRLGCGLRHGDDVLHVAGACFGGGSTVCVAGAARAAGRRVAALDDEAGHDPVEDRVVEEVVIRERDERGAGCRLADFWSISIVKLPQFVSKVTR